MSREYCDHILDRLSPLRGVAAKRMFGGFGLFRGWLMFALIADDTLYFKTADSNRTDYEEAGAEPFRYQARGKDVTLSYWNAPPEVLDDDDTLVSWAEKACHAARQAQDAKKKPVKTSR